MSIRPSSVKALTDSSVLHPDIAMHAFIPERTVTKLELATDKAIVDSDDDIIPNALLKQKHQTDSIIKQHLKNNISSGSPTPPPPDDDPDDWFEKLKKNYEKKALFYNEKLDYVYILYILSCVLCFIKVIIRVLSGA